MHFMFRHITLMSRLNGGVGERGEHFFPPFPFLIVQLLIPSALSLYLWSCGSIFYFILFFLSCFHSFHQLQSLDQVALTNATILDGSGGGPNGSLAGSMGSVAVCLPSESSLTDSLHTSAVSLQRIDAWSTSGILNINQLSSTNNKIWLWTCCPGRLVLDYNSSVFSVVAKMIKQWLIHLVASCCHYCFPQTVCCLVIGLKRIPVEHVALHVLSASKYY